MKNFCLNVRSGIRQLGRVPSFTFVVLVVLALCIAGTTIMFGTLNELLFRGPQGVSEPESIIRIYIVRDEGWIRTPDGGPGSLVDLEALREGAYGVKDVAAFLRPQKMDYGLGIHAERVRGRSVSPSFFSVLGVDAAVGRLFGPGDRLITSEPNVTILSHEFWKREFGADSEIVGRTLLLDGGPMVVVGVASADFSGVGDEAVDLWTPLDVGGLADRADVAAFNYVARVARGANEEQLRTSAEVRLAAKATEFPGMDPSPKVLLGPLNVHRGPHPSGSVRFATGLLLATVVLLLIACANVANLFLARATIRDHEFAVRRALGASRGRILVQLLTESIVQTLAAGAIGWVLAVFAASLLRKTLGLGGHSLLDLRVLGFAVFASVGTGVLLGVVSALQGSRDSSVVNRTDEGLGRGPRRGRMSAVLIASQVALAVVLLFGAGLVVRALQDAVTIDPGLDFKSLVVASMDPRSAGYGSSEAQALFQRGRNRLEADPGVEVATLVMPMPLSGAGWGVSVADGPGGDIVRVPEGPYTYTVGADFFRTAGILLLAGRPLLDEDRRGSEPVAVVSESLARALGGSVETVVGRCIPIGVEERQSGTCTRIVGIAADVRRNYLVASSMPYIYRPASQYPFEEGPESFTPQFLLRVKGDPRLHLGAIRSALQGLAPDLPYIEVQTMEELIGTKAIRPFRVASWLLTAFGFFALFLAAMGLYSSLSYLVANRTREIGVRIALGARRSKVVRSVVSGALVPVLVGLGSGLVVARALARLAAVENHGLNPHDPVVSLCVVVALLVAALAASWLPARRASLMDPVAALRD